MPFRKGEVANPNGRPRTAIPELFWPKVQKTDTCWFWTAACDPAGYGHFGYARDHAAHRIAYELTHGPIPKGLHLHHCCANKTCVNPDHLELITPRRHKQLHGPTHCPYGHAYDLVNTGYSRSSKGIARRCLACHRQAQARRQQQRRSA